jgi:proline iminopeptidase
MIHSPKSLLIVLLAVCICCVKAKNELQTNSQAQGGYVDAGGGVRLFYRLLGAGPDTVVVIHGGPGFTMDYFLEDLRPLANDHALLFYDQRGTGGSTLVSDSASLVGERFVDDLESLRKHFGIKRLNLLGHSWGTGVAALYAMRYPRYTGKMIMVGVLPLQEHQLIDAFSQLDARRDSVTRRQMRELYAARVADPANAELCRQYYVLWFEAFYGDPAKPALTKGDFCAGAAEARLNKMKSVDRFTFQSLGAWDWRSSLSKVKSQSLIIHGTNDPLPSAGAQAWADVLPNSKLMLLDGIGHFPYIEVPDRFFKTVNEFLHKADRYHLHE